MEDHNSNPVLQGVSDTILAIGNALAGYAKAIQRFLQSEAFLNFAQQMVKFAEFVQKNGTTFREALERLPSWLEGGVCALAHDGWFIDPDVPMSLMLDAIKLDDGNVRSRVEAEMVAHFEEHLDLIEERIVEFAPSRERLIRSAFMAVRRGEDDLAVPLLFIQADGIFADHRLGSFFVRDRAKRDFPAPIKRLMDDGYEKSFMFAPVFQLLPLYMTRDERSASFIGLNRHLVLHGLSLDYGTHANSLRAVSFLNFVVCLLMDWQKRSKAKELSTVGVGQGSV